LNVNPNHAEPRNYKRWVEVIRLMRVRDKRSRADIARLFAWANADVFWKTNILSPGSLREKWDQLMAKRVSAGGGITAPPVGDRRCVCGCGLEGTRSFGTGGGQRWAAACFERESLRREAA
jgi:hypothetical protein